MHAELEKFNFPEQGETCFFLPDDLLSCVSPLLSLNYHTHSEHLFLTLLIAKHVECLPHNQFSATQLHVLQFISVQTLPIWRLRSHRLRAQSHKRTPTSLRCQLPVVGPWAACNFYKLEFPTMPSSGLICQSNSKNSGKPLCLPVY